MDAWRLSLPGAAEKVWHSKRRPALAIRISNLEISDRAVKRHQRVCSGDVRTGRTTGNIRTLTRTTRATTRATA